MVVVGKEWWFVDENTASKGPQMGMVCLEIKEGIPEEVEFGRRLDSN